MKPRMDANGRESGKNIRVDSRGLAVSKEERIKPRMVANVRVEEGNISVD